MKKWSTVMVLAMAAALPAYARDVLHVIPIAEALQSPQAKARIDPSIKLFFGAQQYPQGEVRGAGNSRGKEKIEQGEVRGPGNSRRKEKIEQADEKGSCRASFAEAIQLLQQQARSQGANAIVRIASYYKSGPTRSSETEFECHAGTNNTGVMLQGDFVRLPD